MMDERINEALGTEVACYEQEPTTECLYHTVEDAQDLALFTRVQKSQIHSPVLTNMVIE